MPDNVPTEFERFVNEVAADTAVLKAVVTAMIAKLALARPEIIDDLEEISKLSHRPNERSVSGNQLVERLHQLTLSRTDDYFRDLREVVQSVQARARPRSN